MGDTGGSEEVQNQSGWDGGRGKGEPHLSMWRVENSRGRAQSELQGRRSAWEGDGELELGSLHLRV